MNLPTNIAFGTIDSNFITHYNTLYLAYVLAYSLWGSHLTKRLLQTCRNVTLEIKNL